VTLLYILSIFNVVSVNNLFSNNLAIQNSVPVKTGTSVEESQVVNTVEKTNPAVVSIIISKDVPTYENNNFYNYLFNYNSNSNTQQNGTQKQEIGGGSGFFVSRMDILSQIAML